MTGSRQQNLRSFLLSFSVLIFSISARKLSAPALAAHPASQSAQAGASIPVTLNLSVWDKQNRPVRNLDASQFHIFVAGHEQAIESLVPVPSHPISMVFLEDQSGSRIEQVGQKKSYFEMPAASRFLESLAAGGNNVTVASFAQGVKVFGPIQEDPSSDPNHIDSTLVTLTHNVPHGPTALFDALSWASKQLASEPGYHAVVMVTDGIDNFSHASSNETVAIAQASKISVFFLDTIHSGNEQNRRTISGSEHNLSEAARRIGGESLFMDDARSADADFAKIAAHIATSYNVSFRFDSSKLAKELHSLKVTVDGDHLTVFSPAGDYALTH